MNSFDTQRTTCECFQSSVLIVLQGAISSLPTDASKEGITELEDEQDKTEKAKFNKDTLEGNFLLKAQAS